MNLTLTYSQNSFIKNHINIVPASVKYIFEKSFNKISEGTVMKVHRSNRTIINYNHKKMRKFELSKISLALTSTTLHNDYFVRTKVSLLFHSPKLKEYYKYSQKLDYFSKNCATQKLFSHIVWEESHLQCETIVEVFDFLLNYHKYIPCLQKV